MRANRSAHPSLSTVWRNAPSAIGEPASSVHHRHTAGVDGGWGGGGAYGRCCPGSRRGPRVLLPPLLALRCCPWWSRSRCWRWPCWAMGGVVDRVRERYPYQPAVDITGSGRCDSQPHGGGPDPMSECGGCISLHDPAKATRWQGAKACHLRRTGARQTWKGRGKQGTKKQSQRVYIREMEGSVLKNE